VAYIYKITNTLNNKSYIGSTVKDINFRFNEHCRKTHVRNNNISKAIQLFGRENFTLELLDVVSSDSRFLMEHNYIIKENTLYPNGYNLTDLKKYGFKNGNKQKLMPSKKCLEAAWAANTGAKRTLETKQLQRFKKLGKPTPWVCKKVEATCKQTKLKYVFTSISSASVFFNIKRRSISNVLHGWNKSAGGFIFKAVI
jgi:hypothetical protein